MFSLPILNFITVKSFTSNTLMDVDNPKPISNCVHSLLKGNA